MNEKTTEALEIVAEAIDSYEELKASFYVMRNRANKLEDENARLKLELQKLEYALGRMAEDMADASHVDFLKELYKTYAEGYYG